MKEDRESANQDSHMLEQEGKHGWGGRVWGLSRGTEVATKWAQIVQEPQLLGTWEGVWGGGGVGRGRGGVGAGKKNFRG